MNGENLLVGYKIHDFKYEWKGNFGHARACVEVALEQIDHSEYHLNIWNHTDITKVSHQEALFIKPTAPTSKHFAIDDLGYANSSSLAFRDYGVYETMYSHLNPNNDMDWNNIKSLIDNKSNKWDDSAILKWRKPKNVPRNHTLVIGQMPKDETVEGFGFGGHIRKLDLIVERLVKETDYPIVVKMHPKLQKRDRLIDKWKSWGVDVREGFESIHDILPRTRVAIVDNSTAGIECLMHQVPVISTGWPEYHWVTEKLQVLPQLPRLIKDLEWHELDDANKFIYWYIHDYLCYDVESTKRRLKDILDSWRL